MDEREGVPRSQQLRIKAFAYDDDAVQVYADRWEGLKRLKAYADLLESAEEDTLSS